VPPLERKEESLPESGREEKPPRPADAQSGKPEPEALRRTPAGSG